MSISSPIPSTSLEKTRNLIQKLHGEASNKEKTKILKELDLIEKTVLTELQLKVVGKDIAQFEQRLALLKGRSESTKPESLQKESIKKNLIQKLSQDMAKTQALIDKFLQKPENPSKATNDNLARIQKDMTRLKFMPESSDKERLKQQLREATKETQALINKLSGKSENSSNAVTVSPTSNSTSLRKEE